MCLKEGRINKPEGNPKEISKQKTHTHTVESTKHYKRLWIWESWGVGVLKEKRERSGQRNI